MMAGRDLAVPQASELETVRTEVVEWLDGLGSNRRREIEMRPETLARYLARLSPEDRIGVLEILHDHPAAKVSMICGFLRLGYGIDEVVRAYDLGAEMTKGNDDEHRTRVVASGVPVSAGLLLLRRFPDSPGVNGIADLVRTTHVLLRNRYYSRTVEFLLAAAENFPGRTPDEMIETVQEIVQQGQFMREGVDDYTPDDLFAEEPAW